MKRITRRRMMTNVAAAGALAAMSKNTNAQSTQPATTQALSPSELSAADKLLGHNYTADEEQMMLPGVTGKRKVLAGLRQRAIDPNLEPAIQFNPRLPGTVVPAGPSSFALSDAAMPEFDGKVESLAFASAADLSRLIHGGKVTSVALTRMYLARLKTIGHKLNAVVTMTEDLALAQARRADEELAAGKDRGPLHGIPYGGKDCFATKNIPTSWGVEIYKDRVLDHDATIIAKLEEAGAVLCAKLSLGELCMGDVWFKGKTLCPWNIKEGSNGSSAGPCATVAAGCIAFAIGTETHGSIISPCMQNGTTGLRPTYGRISRYGAMPLSRSLDKVGPIARSVEDCAMLLHVLHGRDDKDPTAADVPFSWNAGDVSKLRVGYDPAAYEFGSSFYKKNPKLREVHEAALEKVRSLVASLEPIQIPAREKYAGVLSLCIASECASSFSDLLTSGDVRKLKQQDADAWPNAFRIGSMIPAADYLRAMQLRAQLQRDFADAMKDVDLYMTIPYVGPTVEFTNLTGHPSLVTRAGIVNGRPKTMEFIGQLYQEEKILRLAHAFERSTDFHKLWPDTSAL